MKQNKKNILLKDCHRNFTRGIWIIFSSYQIIIKTKEAATQKKLVHFKFCGNLLISLLNSYWILYFYIDKKFILKYMLSSSFPLNWKKMPLESVHQKMSPKSIARQVIWSICKGVNGVRIPIDMKFKSVCHTSWL